MMHQCAKCGKATIYFDEVYCVNMGRPETIYLCKEHLDEINETIMEYIGGSLS